MSKNNASVTAYKEVCKVLGVTPAKIDKNIPDKAGATTIIVPNTEFEWEAIKKLAVNFGKKQPYQTYIYDDLYQQYSAQELSGKPTRAAYRVIYIPKQYNVKADTAVNQKKDNPGRVPSVLEAIVCWYTLRESNEILNFDTTYIRHFNLTPKRLGDWLHVPDSYVYYAGEPHLHNSGAGVDYDARLLVGSKLDTFSSSAVPLSLYQQTTDYLLEQGHSISKPLIDDIVAFIEKNANQS